MQGKKFRFSLASILRLRQHETERTKLDLAKKMQDRRKQEQEVSEAREVLAELSPVIKTNQPVEIGVFRRLEAHKHDARQTLLKAQERLRNLEVEEQKTRQDLLKKRSAEEALQTLHDKEKDTHIRELNTAENKRIEEQALDNYRRQQLTNNNE